MADLDRLRAAFARALTDPYRRGPLVVGLVALLVASVGVFALTRGGGATLEPERASAMPITVEPEEARPAEAAPLEAPPAQEKDKKGKRRETDAEQAPGTTEAPDDTEPPAGTEPPAPEAEAPPPPPPPEPEPAAPPAFDAMFAPPGQPAAVAGTPAPPGIAPLTGEFGDFGGRLGRPALMVKVDNVPMARPQAGVRDADIVIEEPVEGNYTRLAAIFHSRDAYVGPIRSARTTDFEIFPLIGRLLFSAAGANPGVYSQLRQQNVFDIGHPTPFAHFYQRVGDRPMPHNLFTSTEVLYQAAPEQPPPPRPMFSYLGAGEPLAAGATPSNGVALSFGGHEVARFRWDAGSGTWPRIQEGTPHVDTSGASFAPRNVVVLETDYSTSGVNYQSIPHGHSVGGGRAIVLTQGHAIVGRWERPALSSPIRLVSDAGQDIKLTPGQTFVELPLRGGAALL